ncbi:hypothetical protein CAMRE0001_0569 [Campylobacter rectus RM3267]|uniref:Uncharacterized protein n=1 Tax=Campylobacter rectus RM3267 TaxID=553218 RepID=B9D5P7_CAMRE|nr:hypothetical protein CAMRE0001_0569 [Campylobacter rectus RM3267]
MIFSRYESRRIKFKKSNKKQKYCNISQNIRQRDQNVHQAKLVAERK